MVKNILETTADTTMPRHNSTNLEDEISWVYIGPETETQVK
jgi:hypothetical protein